MPKHAHTVHATHYSLINSRSYPLLLPSSALRHQNKKNNDMKEAALIMEVTGGQELVVWNKDHQAQQVIKGKRTKRPRLPSPLRLSMASSCSSAGGRASTDDHSGGSSSVVDMATTSTDQLRVSTEEEDMANCLILLAQGHNTRHEPSSHNNDDKASSGMYLYQCKTCDRCFPSFQALGGHRASHKKTKPNNSEEKLQAVAFANEEAHHHQPCDPTGTSFVLSLQISNSSHNNTNNKSKVHECSICGVEFTSGQALGGHMRRHRTLVNNSAATACTGNNNSQLQPTNKPATKNVLKLDLNLPAPEDDHRESKVPFQSKDNVLVFSASSLVDCHY